jgi:hypothetical protein
LPVIYVRKRDTIHVWNGIWRNEFYWREERWNEYVVKLL